MNETEGNDRYFVNVGGIRYEISYMQMVNEVKPFMDRISKRFKNEKAEKLRDEIKEREEELDKIYEGQKRVYTSKAIPGSFRKKSPNPNCPFCKGKGTKRETTFGYPGYIDQPCTCTYDWDDYQ